MAEALRADRDERSAALKRRKVLDEGLGHKLEANVDELCRAIKEWVSELRSANERHYDKLAYTVMYNSRANNTEEVLVRTHRYLRDKQEELLRTHRCLLDKEEELLRTHRCLLDKEEELLRTHRCLLDKEQEIARICTDIFAETQKTAGFLDTAPRRIPQNEQSENKLSVPLSAFPFCALRDDGANKDQDVAKSKELKNDNGCLSFAEKNKRSDSTVMGSPDTTPGVFLQKEQNHDKHEDEFAKTAVGAGGGGGLAFYNQCVDTKSSSAQMHVQGTSRGDAYDKERALIHEVGMSVCELCHVRVHWKNMENHRQGRKHMRRRAMLDGPLR